MAIEVREITEDADLRSAARTDLASFGYAFDETRFTKTLEARRVATSYLATDGDTPVGACMTHGFDMTLPGGSTVAVSGVADVGVLASHRRRGVLTEMMDRMLADSSAAGRVAAGLHASEATIYGRFGFGAATRHRKVSIATSRASMRTGAAVAPGSVEVVHPEGRGDLLREVHEQAMARRPGEVQRLDAHWNIRIAGDASDESKMLCLVHRRPSGEPDAYALYRIAADWAPAGPEHVLEVQELVAIDDASELAIWQAVLGLDLVATVISWVPRDSILFDALEDRWAPHSIGEHDGLWLRVLDLPKMLAERRYRIPESLVLEVTDTRMPSGAITAGTWRIEVDHTGVASIGSTSDSADLVLDVAELASVILGGGSLARLAAVGLVTESTVGAARRGDALFGWWPTPWITEFF
ncbi:MAG: GNAT family N-acetyltransferase [Microthrixaceae bacterium]